MRTRKNNPWRSREIRGRFTKEPPLLGKKTKIAIRIVLVSTLIAMIGVLLNFW